MNTFEFTVDGVRYSVNDDNTTVTVAGYPSDSEPTGDLTIPESVTFRGCPYRVTSIGVEAFDECSGLTSVTIPNSVISIGKGAFYECSGLTSVIIGNSVTEIGGWAFSGCSGLTSVTIPNSVTEIGYGAFWGCSGLTSVIIGNSVTEIGYEAFRDCTGLTSVVWNAKNCIYFSSGQFRNLTNIKTFEFGSEVEKIPAYLCYGLTGLTSVTIPNSVTEIGPGAFSGCSGLTSVVWNVKNCSGFSYDYPPFEDLTNIKKFEFGSEVERIPAYLCYGLSGLTSVTIPNSVTEIGKVAFCDCSGLTSIIVESGNSVYDSRENCNAIIETATNTLISGCKNTMIPNSVTSIGPGAFSGCRGLTSLTIGNSVTSIDGSAFYDCSGLTSIIVESGNSVYDSRENCNAIIETATNKLITGCKNTIIPNSVTSIGQGAFSGCTGLTSVTIGNSVTSIGAFAFSDCSGLTSVTIGNSVTSIGDYAFIGCSGLTSVTIPNSVTEIGDWAFCDCSGLTSVTIPNTVTSIGDEAFRDCSGLTRIDAYPNPKKVSIGEDAFDGVPKDVTLHVLPKYLSAYQRARQWKRFTNIKGDLTEIGASTSMDR